MNTEPTPDTAEQPTPPAALQAKVDQLEAQVNDYKLLLADMQNSTRRLREDAEKQKKYFAEPLARDALTIIDNLERVVEAAKKAGESGTLVDGLAATISATVDILKRHAVKKIDVAPGSPFDPNLHQAVSEMPTNDVPPGAVARVLQHGFLLHDRMLRPATVIVASEPPAGGSSS